MHDEFGIAGVDLPFMNGNVAVRGARLRWSATAGLPNAKLFEVLGKAAMLHIGVFNV